MEGLQKNKLRIRVLIADKPFVLTISSDEEERVRGAAKDINSRIEELRRLHKVDVLDSLAMAALQISIANQENLYKLDHSIEALELQQMKSEIDEFLDKKID
ncbi:MAG: cell division protein ZapA [Mucinivorans sp.]